MRNAIQLQADAWTALVTGLGMADALRYRILCEDQRGDYVHERDALFKDVTLDEWVSAAKATEARRPTRTPGGRRARAGS